MYRNIGYFTNQSLETKLAYSTDKVTANSIQRYLLGEFEGDSAQRGTVHAQNQGCCCHTAAMAAH